MKKTFSIVKVIITITIIIVWTLSLLSTYVPGTVSKALFTPFHFNLMTSLVAQMVKRLPTMRETRVQSLGWEDLLEKEMATHSIIFYP